MSIDLSSSMRSAFWFSSGAPLLSGVPTACSAGAHAIEDGVSIVTSNWLAEHLGINPRYVAGFQGYGQIPGAVAIAVNAVAFSRRKRAKVR